MKTRRRNVCSEDHTREYTESIPNDLLIEILSRLPSKSVARCRCVSKLWESTLRLPNFTDSYLTRSRDQPHLLFSSRKDGKMFFSSASLDDNSSTVTVTDHMNLPFDEYRSEICGSVHGLICLTHVRIFKGRSETVPVICNTSTGQSLTSLPKVMTKKRKMFKVKTFFGYDPINDEFKILCMTRPSYESYQVRRISEEHQVLTLGTKKPTWRMIDGVMTHYPLSDGICIDGVVYYVAFVNKSPWVPMIVCFDVRSEKFGFVERGDDMTFLKDSTLVNYKGKLGALLSDGLDGFLFQRVSGGTRSLEMRVLEDAEKHVWSKHVYELPFLWKLDYVRDDKLYFAGVVGGTNEIVLAPRYVSDRFFVLYYDIERRTVRRVEYPGMGAFKDCRVYTSVHVEDVKFMEMFRTYNLRSCNRS